MGYSILSEEVIKVPRIKCSVGDCLYQEGNECKASSIQVRPTAMDTMITVSDDTACGTFIPRHTVAPKK
ncbi:DUF1540 domain-containing protein [Thermanaeromonas sp. C210]|uniref:DUF1540 domain-containing protein n=1 Tax=Thermanaeromonas sp. C210 TaxID=2731925 RepID=UPI0035A62A0F